MLGILVGVCSKTCRASDTAIPIGNEAASPKQIAMNPATCRTCFLQCLWGTQESIGVGFQDMPDRMP